MDVRAYVKVKTLPGGSRADCSFYSGVVFTKNVAHKKMQFSMKYDVYMTVAIVVFFFGSRLT